jgi:hypothetical protein
MGRCLPCEIGDSLNFDIKDVDEQKVVGGTSATGTSRRNAYV